ncbi:DUF4440 domain-containing protein [Streptomyces sp. NPDC006475]|uniref:nuclear transport factor 2 family protein n=1 Tax=Streptomyces sp. NPDC006475 TaxID=3155719 RepID=UPI0033B1CB35
MYDVDEQAVRAVLEGELRLLGVPVRASAETVGELLDAEFVEFDTSGKRCDQASVVAAYRGAVPLDGTLTVSDMAAALLAPGLVHVTYRSGSNDGCALRSSLWRRTPAGWRRYFHQGTLSEGT